MSEPYGYTIFCDDIRDEVGSKSSFMGRYLNEMIVASAAPAALPKFAVATHLLVPMDMQFDRGRVSLQLHVGDDITTLQEFEFTSAQRASLPEGADLFLINVNFILAPLALPGECMLKVRGYLDGREVRAGALRIRFQAPEKTSAMAEVPT